MSGYILSLYKAAMPSQEDAKSAIKFTEKKQWENGKAWNGAITFAHFDRVTVSPVNNFDEYRSVFDQSHWLGECRHVMIYDIPSAGAHSDIEFYDNPACVFAFRETNRDRLPRRRFACITMLNVDSGLYFAEHTKYSSGKDGGVSGSPLNRISDAICRTVDEKFGGGALRYKIFGVLGENDLCIVWLSDQYTNIAEAINYIRCITIKSRLKKLRGRPLVNTTYSVLVPNCKTALGETDFEKVDGDVELCLTLRNGYAGNTGGNAYCQKLESAIRENLRTQGIPQDNLSIDCSLGEYDIIFRFPAGALNLRWYMKTGDQADDGLLHYRNIEYVKNVFQVETVFLCKPQAVVDGAVYKFKPANKKCTLIKVKRKLFYLYKAESPKTIADRVDNIHKIIVDLLDYVSRVTSDSHYLHEALWLSYHEYLRIIPSAFCNHWIVDIDRQYYAMLKCIWNIVKCNFSEDKVNLYDNKTRAYREIEQLFNEIRQSFLHVTQTDRLFFELYQSTLYNAGSFNKILRAYYGLIKCVLYLCYTFKRVDGNKQAELVPLVTLNVTPIVESTMYTETFSPDVRLMVIRLPYKALTGLPQYMNVLVHEIFHYICPSDRKKRNYAFGSTLMSFAMGEFLICAMQAIYKNNRNLDCKKKDGAKPETCESDRKTDEKALLLVKSYVAARWLDFTGQIVRDHYMKINDAIIKVDDPENNRDDDSKKNDANIKDDDPENILWDAYLKKLSALFLVDAGAVSDKISDFAGQLAGALKSRLQSGGTLPKEADKYSEIERALTLSLNDDEDITKCDFYKTLVAQIQDSRKNDIVLKNTFQIASGIREAVADIMMIGLLFSGEGATAGSKLRNYLLAIDNIRKDMMVYQEKGSEEIDFQIVRIGLVLDTYLQPADNEKEQLSSANSWIDAAFPGKGEEGEREECRRIRERVKADYKTYVDLIMPTQRLQYALHPLRDQLDVNLINYETDGDSYFELRDQYISKLRSFYTSYRRLWEDGDAKGQFALNIEMMSYFQAQFDSYELKTTIGISETKMGAPKLPYPNYPSSGIPVPSIEHDENSIMVHSPNAFLRALEVAAHQINPEARHPILWYRGHTSCNYKLLPGIMRDTFMGDPELLCPNLNSLMKYTKANIHNFAAIQADHYRHADWLACMQHYGIPTNILDWSEEAFTALYFAMEGWMKLTDKGEPVSTDATVWVLNPAAMNGAMNWLYEHEHPPKAGSACPLLPDIDKSLTLPNLCAEHDDEKKYLCYIDCTCKDKKRKSHYPLAAFTSLANARIRAQAGTFTFFHLHSAPNNGNFDNYAIEAIQKRYLKVRKDAPPFLFRIDIDHLSCKAFVNCVRDIGIKKSKVYPELDKLSEEIARLVKKP